MRLASLAVVAAASLAASAARAQSCTVSAGSNSGRLLTWYAAPLAFEVAQMPRPQAPWKLGLSLEATRVPAPSPELQRVSECGRTRVVSTDLSPVVPRPRLSLGLPGRFVLEGAWVPPVPVVDATANLVSVALSRVTPLVTVAGGELALVARGHGTFGRVRGAIACPEERVQQVAPAAPCWGTNASNDSYRPNVAGVEGIVSFDGALYGLYAGGGWTSLDPTFRVGFDDRAGNRDSTWVSLDRRVSRGAFVVGGMYQVARRVELSGQIHAGRDDLVLARTSITWRLP